MGEMLDENEQKLYQFDEKERIIRQTEEQVK